ncbi:MAG: inorganic phosphate transporter [Candidatus Omnitrophica bacterium]|nr:inorganic phosphate transporter [Candidatus Omnitrophota bacterium]MCM8799473.1 inorganic phosphate transporter [Candidatus Omnitrophota bacterium]
MIKIILLFLISIFWAMNMGASGLAVSFAPSVGSNIIRKDRAVLFFTLFVLIGSFLVGGKVAKTLSSKIIAPAFISQEVILIILFSACFALFLANLFKIPQSTSIITVGAFVGAGLYFKSLNFSLIGYLVLVWMGVSVLSYFITYAIAQKIYPPRQKNLRFYEKLFCHQQKLKRWTLFTDYYSAFGIGTNNVANVVGPLIAANIIKPNIGFLIFSIFFGLGGLVLGKGVLNTVSKEIVPLGILSASLVSFVVSTFIIACSLLGLPAPYVQFSSLSILAIHTLKEGKNHLQTLIHPVTKRILKVWMLTPILSIITCYLLLFLLRIKR